MSPRTQAGPKGKKSWLDRMLTPGQRKMNETQVKGIRAGLSLWREDAKRPDPRTEASQGMKVVDLTC